MSPSKKARGGPPGDEKEKVELPEFGLAEDILAALEAQVAAQAADAEVMARAVASEPLPSPHGPERVYAFVDRLQSRATVQPEQEREVPETWVSFELEGEVFALPVTRVQEVLRITSITRVPHAPAPVRGITNLRGRVLAIVDTRVRLGLPPAAIGPQSRIVVVSSRERSIGLLVDAARQVLKILPSGIQAPPPDVMTDRSGFILGVHHSAESLVILLDVDRVLWIPESPGLSPEPEPPGTPGGIDR